MFFHTAGCLKIAKKEAARLESSGTCWDPLNHLRRSRATKLLQEHSLPSALIRLKAKEQFQGVAFQALRGFSACGLLI